MSFGKLYKRLFLNKKGFFLLIDPDKANREFILDVCNKINTNDKILAFLVGTSIMLTPRIDEVILTVKENSNLPVLLFPGSSLQISPYADGILYLILVSGRNPEFLIGEHVRSAFLLRHYNIEVISTAYILIESGTYTAVEYMSQTRPLPREKPEIALAHAIAAEMIGVKVLYLEGGSGAKYPIPTETIKIIKENTNLPIIVGGGYREKSAIESAFESGADIVVIGTAIEENINLVEELLS